MGLSGGVDSAVAALLLQRRGVRVSAVFMKNWEEDDRDGRCAAEQDLADARAVCERLGLPLESANFSDAYWERVFERFLADHRAGLTPNPDVLCNREIKFRAFLDHALARGADRIATGHYARVARAGGDYRLLRGADPDKDQTYFLYTLGQRELARVRFPVGHLSKPEVRRLAAEAGLANHARKGSTGICFIGERQFRPFLARFLPATPGEIRTAEGEPVGHHRGLAFYTLGQRRGLGIGGRRGARAAPWFVLAKDRERNILVVAQDHDHPALQRTSLDLREVHWVAGAPPSGPVACSARIRYRQADQPCRATPLGEDRCRVHFDQPQRAATPGQSVVFYQGEECLGGGVIEPGGPWPSGGAHR
ncbi:MAG: tRNA 2-thiouridine(34) synthase MnmA [Gammaproteobacteria bacterium]|nr:tRNA 2-thiouridine(34) synthase MnmA [Gammaproteobacteria bacterium]